MTTSSTVSAAVIGSGVGTKSRSAGAVPDIHSEANMTLSATERHHNR